MKPYVRAVVYLGLYLPVAAMAYLVWQGQAALGFCTIGVYVLQLLTQIRSEMVFLNKG